LHVLDTLQSLNAEAAPFEVILCDDGSSDGLLEEIEKIKEDTKEGFESVKQDVSSVSGWIKHLESEKNIEWLQGNPDIFIPIIEYHRNFRYPEIPDLDADAALYQMGFMSRKTEALCRQFHLAPIQEKEKLIGQFQIPETKTLALRVLARNYPESLSSAHWKNFREYMRKVTPPAHEKALCDYKGNLRTTPFSALAEIKELKKSSDIESIQLSLLDELETYIIKTFQQDF